LLFKGIYSEYHIYMSKKLIPGHQQKHNKEISLFIALFIRNWRLNEGLTQIEFSKLANVHVNSIYNLEHQKGININTLINCLDAMEGMTISEFFDCMK
jgi:hypothetical protein